MRTTIRVTQQFCGPPNSGNGGYVSGLMGALIKGPATAVLRARVPLDAPLALERTDGRVRLLAEDGTLVGEASPVDGVGLSTPPPAPTLAAATAAGLRFPGLAKPFHPICFTCGDKQAEGFGLRVFTGQLEGAAEGVVAGVWSAHPAFADAEGLATAEVVWAALDCPGSVAWVVQGESGGLLGTMTCEILRRPKAGEPCIVLAWPISREGRKSFSGTALYSADGELLARSHQVWITVIWTA